MIASKGARAVLAAQGRPLIDFGSCRAHGTDAALKAARALYLAGFVSTSNVLAGSRYDIPTAGTMAHSYIEAHRSKIEAFRAFLATYLETVGRAMGQISVALLVGRKKRSAVSVKGRIFVSGANGVVFPGIGIRDLPAPPAAESTWSLLLSLS